MKIKEAVDALERFAPLPLQESFDNAGLQVGLTEAEVSGVLLCLDVTEAVIDEAAATGYNLIVSHHPLIFNKLARITGENYICRCIMKAIKHDIAIVSMHTNMDAAAGGVNYKIAEKIGLAGVHFIGETKEAGGVAGGSGIMGRFPESVSSEDFIALLKKRFDVECVQTNQLLRRPITTVAICGGAGAFLLDEALRCKADAFLTGEMSYHNFFGHDQQIQIAVIGHYQSEQFTPEIFHYIFSELGVDCRMTQTSANPIHYF